MERDNEKSKKYVRIWVWHANWIRKPINNQSVRHFGVVLNSGYWHKCWLSAFLQCMLCFSHWTKKNDEFLPSSLFRNRFLIDKTQPEESDNVWPWQKVLVGNWTVFTEINGRMTLKWHLHFGDPIDDFERKTRKPSLRLKSRFSWAVGCAEKAAAPIMIECLLYGPPKPLCRDHRHVNAIYFCKPLAFTFWFGRLTCARTLTKHPVDCDGWSAFFAFIFKSFLCCAANSSFCKALDRPKPEPKASRRFGLIILLNLNRWRIKPAVGFGRF